MNRNQTATDKFQAVIAEIDRRNAKDPNRDDDNGQAVAKELLYSQRLTDWVKKLDDHPSEQLLLATRAQHIERWHTPRQDYPDGLSGYLKWRKNLQKFHAKALSEIMKSVGYDDESIAQAADLILKKNFSKNPQGQVLEDAVCMVFLQFELAKFAAKTETDKTIHIIRKTWVKMSESAQQIALTLPMAPSEERLIKTCLSG